jgi:hypothetical protein
MRWVFFFACLAAIPSVAPADTWYITADGTGDAPTIQAGVDSAATGDTVLVAPGTYDDTTHVSVAGTIRPVNVSIDRNIVLLGETSPDEVLIHGIDSDVCVYMSGVDASCLIEGIGIFREPVGFGCITPASPRERAPEPVPGDAFLPCGIYLENAGPRIECNRLYDLHIGIRQDGGSPSIAGNAFHAVGAGIDQDFYATSGGSVTGNSFIEFGMGVGAFDPLTITGNTFNWGEPGPPTGCVGVNDWAGSLIEDNRFEYLSNEAVSTGGGTVVRNNRFRNCYRAAYVGGDGSTVTGNVFVDNLSAVQVPGFSGSATIENNTIDGCGLALTVELPVGLIEMRRNIVVNSDSYLSCVATEDIVFECNAIFNSGIDTPECLDEIPAQYNFTADPQFCGVPGSGLYTLQSDSPCAPGNHPDGIDCGQIGAFPVGCGEVKVQTKSWGRVKAMWRGTEEE